MTSTPFDSLPDSARIWINAADRDLSTREQGQIKDLLVDFIAGWSSHGRKVEGSAAILADRFVVIAAYIPGGDVSGCGIDASVHALAGIAEATGFTWAPALDVFYRQDGGIRQVDRMTFSDLAAHGHVAPDTIVYDPSLTTLGEWRSKGFELPARNAWHSRVFRFESEAV
ncbi:MAG: hypothetical protein WBW88_15890 [Rhodothermales bacterium]|jgi:hypothetical protein